MLCVCVCALVYVLLFKVLDEPQLLAIGSALSSCMNGSECVLHEEARLKKGAAFQSLLHVNVSG